MILQALNQLYERLADDPAYDMPTPGHSVQRITFCVTLTPDGTLHAIEDARATESETTKSGQVRTRQTARPLLVPGESKPSGQGINPCTLWDNSAYLLGYKKPDKDPEKAAKEKARAALTFEASNAHHLAIERAINDPAYSAVCRFLEQWSPDRAQDWSAVLDDFAATGFGVFRVLPERGFVHERKAFKDWWAAQSQASVGEEKITAPCLVTGIDFPVARLHDPPIKGVNGAAAGGAKLASFNQDAFESYAKGQSHNSPVSERATFQYCNALNALLSGPQSRRHRITVGDTTVAFWTERETVAESVFASFLGGQLEGSEPASVTLAENPLLAQRLAAFLNLLRRGGGAAVEQLGDNPHTRYYILGLSGNVTRLAVRFWHVGTLGELFELLRAHYEALRLKRSFDNEPEFPSTIRVLDQTARERKAISPLLSGQLLQAILAGTAYPMALVNGVINRIRSNDPINYLKASVLKAYLVRNQKIAMSEALDITRTEPAYHLGRLFAVYETAQKHAHDWKLDRTIRETMYSAASATPLSVFGRLERLHHHHTAKKSHPPGSSDSYADIVAEISQHFRGPGPVYPTTLDITHQSLFAVGYYHQLQHFRDLNAIRKQSAAAATESEN